MTVSQFEQDLLWEPETPREAVAGAIASLRVDGLELDEFDGLPWIGVVPFHMSNVSPRVVTTS